MLQEKPWQFEAIGTHWNIHFPAALNEPAREELQSRIATRIESFDKSYSRFRNDSLVAEMAGKAGTYMLPEDAKPLMDTYVDLYAATGGVFTPLIGQTLSDAGYDASYSLSPRDVTAPPAWEEIITYDFPSLILSEPALLDFGAAGKGYLVDLVAEILEDEQLDAYIVDAGGDLRVKSSELPYTIGLEHPENLEQVLGAAQLASGSICGSAGNRRAWKEWNHIINPVTLEPAQHVRAVWVTSSEARIADGISTCLFFIDPEELRERVGNKYAFEYVVVYADYSFTRSQEFPGELFQNA